MEQSVRHVLSKHFPLIKLEMITAVILAYLWGWDDCLTLLVSLNNPKFYTKFLTLRSFAGCTKACHVQYKSNLSTSSS
jgi:ABC-type glycerol-3-phosphate transport system permease component